MSIHVVDISRGIVAAGMQVEVFVNGTGTQRLITRGAISTKGTLDDVALNATLNTGVYDAVFRVGDYYRGAKVDLPMVPFLDVVTYQFGITDSRQHYHLPFKCTPWGYSCFRGGV